MSQVIFLNEKSCLSSHMTHLLLKSHENMFWVESIRKLTWGLRLATSDTATRRMRWNRMPLSLMSCLSTQSHVWCDVSLWEVTSLLSLFSDVMSLFSNVMSLSRCHVSFQMWCLFSDSFLFSRSHADHHDTGWRRCIECLKLQASFRKRDTNNMALSEHDL